MKRVCGLVLAGLVAAPAAFAQGTRGVNVVRVPTGEALVGRNWLLAIAINEYKEWPPLRGPRKDVASLKQALLSRYAFDTANVVELYDSRATRAAITRTLRELGEQQLRPDDSLLVYYAGHGHTDEFTGTGCWIPHDGGRDRDAKEHWLPCAELRGALWAFPCAHVLVIADACFSGDLLEAYKGEEPSITDEYFRRAWSMRSRQILTSGSSEPVSDTNLGGHSAFAFHLVDTLRRNRASYLDPLQLYVHVRAGVKGQMPLLGSIKRAGHQDGGAYIFFLREGRATKTPVPAPPSGGLDLSDLTRQSETRKQWDAWLARMKADYREVELFVAGSADAALNEKAWERFVGTYPQDDPFSTEDEDLRASAKRELARWRAEAKRPTRRTTTAAGKTLTLDLGGGMAMELVLIPAGEFMMGSPNSEKDRENDEGPQHRVSMNWAFYMGKYEVTQSQYERIMGKNVSRFKGASNPVEMVSWNDATEFCQRLWQLTDRNVRLPTEAEWEYACRAGTTTRFCFGDNDNDLGEYAWYASNSDGKTHPVGSKRPNAWGLHDMHGNVWEWCVDWYGKDYYGRGPRKDPTGPWNGSTRVLRGGSWYGSGWSCRSASRLRLGPPYSLDYCGFRVAVVVAPGR